MNPIDLVDLKAFNEDSLLFEIVSSQENSAYNSFANDEMDCIPTEFEQNYFDELSKVLGEDAHDDILLFQNQAWETNNTNSRQINNTKFSTHSNNTKMENRNESDENDNPFHVNIEEWTSINTIQMIPLDIHQNHQNNEKVRNSLFSFPNSLHSLNQFDSFNSFNCSNAQNPIHTMNSIHTINSINTMNSINSINTMNSVDEKGENEMKEKVSLKWRTQPCAYFQANGFCKKGDKCNFSHEIPHQSVKPFVPADQLYRTKPCHFFFTTGVCRKGENCNFSHDPTIFEKAGGTTSPTQEE